MTAWLFLLLPIAAASGWYAAKKHFLSQLSNTSFPKGYLVGLNYLLNEEPDKAVDVFIKMLEVNTETVETHFALGVLFRRRGEVDRAIRIHQNLIARPQLPKRQHNEALLALGQDYLRAGLFDRAERLFLELVDADTQHKISAIHHLLNIYQQLKRWEEAIKISHQIIAYEPTIKRSIAHYHCELAQLFIQQQQSDLVKMHLKQASLADPSCVRVSLLLGDIEQQKGNFIEALEIYKRVKEQEPDYLSEILASINDCYLKLNREDELIDYLESLLIEYPRISFLIALAELKKKNYGTNNTIEFVAKHLHQRPSLRGLGYLVNLQLENIESNAKISWFNLQKILEKLINARPIYRCIHCGFSSKTLHWLCPSCKQWNTIKTILGLEGD